MATTNSLDADVFALARSDDEACVQVFFVRGTVVADTDSFMLDGAREAPDAGDGEVLGAFLAQFYESATYVPRSVLLSQAPADRDQLREALRAKRGGAVELAVPERGELRALVATAEENAREALAMHRVRWLADRDMTAAALSTLQDELDLPERPLRIECYDISTIQGSDTVASMVVFEDGRPRSDQYRRFRIRSVEGQDDFASMREVLTRRFKRLAERRGLEREASGAGGDRPGCGRARHPRGARGTVGQAARPRRDRRRPGAARCGARCAARPRARRRTSLRAGQARGGDLRRRPCRAGAPAAHLAGALPAAARARRGAPLRRDLPPHRPRQARAPVRPRRRARASGRSASARCCASSAR